MADDFQLPKKKAAIFWPVGTGDSTTLVLRPDQLVMQIDLRHLEKAECDDEPEWPIIDHLRRILPKRAGRPYLAVFVLTHPDKDHIQGFAELRKHVWHTPKIFRDQDDEVMCDDAKVFRREAHRRREAILANPDNIRSGNRLRVIGHDDVLNEDKYQHLPTSCKSIPGHIVQTADGVNLDGHFEAFIHAPFKDDMADCKNNTSLSLNIVLREGQGVGQFFFFGDREYPTIKQIFEVTEENGNEDYLTWDVMLSSHHCSKCVMYWKDEGAEDATLHSDIMDYFEKYARGNAAIVASAHADFTDEDGDNPPHQRAREAYEGIVTPGRFICTHEYPSERSARPMVFTVDERGVHLEDARSSSTRPAGLATAVEVARGASTPPGVQVGFGKAK